MDESFCMATDAATLAVFDPKRLAGRAADDADWWCGDLAGLPEVRAGALTLVELGADGVHRVRVTDGELLPDEQDYAVDVVRGLGVEVVSGVLLLGPAESLPGDGPPDAGRGVLVDVPNGSYDVDVFAIRWFDSPRWWRADFEVPDDAPADLVVVLRPRSGPFVAPADSPRLDPDADRHLFESTTRRVGPEPGMILETKVRKGPSGELTLKPCGPLDYAASLLDDAGVAWKDVVRFQVESVDHEAGRMVGRLIGKVV